MSFISCIPQPYLIVNWDPIGPVDSGVDEDHALWPIKTGTFNTRILAPLSPKKIPTREEKRSVSDLDTCSTKRWIHEMNCNHGFMKSYMLNQPSRTKHYEHISHINSHCFKCSSLKSVHTLWSQVIRNQVVYMMARSLTLITCHQLLNFSISSAPQSRQWRITYI